MSRSVSESLLGFEITRIDCAPGCVSKSADRDHSPCSSAFDLGLHNLSIIILRINTTGKSVGCCENLVTEDSGISLKMSSEDTFVFTEIARYKVEFSYQPLCIKVFIIYLGPVVQSVVSLTSSLRVISLTVLA